ncbi:hypothetical protein MRX96_039023 [Rhipicephalus microplus]
MGSIAASRSHSLHDPSPSQGLKIKHRRRRSAGRGQRNVIATPAAMQSPPSSHESCPGVISVDRIRQRVVCCPPISACSATCGDATLPRM